MSQRLTESRFFVDVFIKQDEDLLIRKNKHEVIPLGLSYKICSSKQYILKSCVNLCQHYTCFLIRILSAPNNKKGKFRYLHKSTRM